jgi:tetratricopeptide (TPR) repeat protein
MAADYGRRGRARGLTDRLSECDVLGRLIEAVRAGESRVLVVRGEAGVGKTVLLEYLAGRAPGSGCRVARAVGVQSEMELAVAGLHQLCAPLLGRAGRMPVPQREALRVAFGVAAGPPPDRFFVGLAVLSLLSEVAGERPLICVIDDEQWLDRASVQALGFVARRLAADPVGLVFAARDPGAELAGLPELIVDGLRDDDARALLESALAGPLDGRVRDLIVAETRGNPLALLELPRGLTPAELAGGFGLPGAAPLAGRIEDSFRRQLDALPAETRRLLQLAAADPSGDRALVWRAAGRLGIPVQAGAPAVEAGLVEFGGRVLFRHPLARSAAYRSAAFRDRQQMHAALAEVTDPIADPDRRAWHRARAAAGPDEEVAAELERSAGRAQARGGIAAAAAFLQRAVELTVDPARRAERALAAAQASLQAGAFDAALGLVATAEAGALDEFQRARVDLVRGHIAFASGLTGDAARLLLDAARRLEPYDLELARETYLTAWGAATNSSYLAGENTLLEICRAIRALPPPPGTLRPLDMLLDGLALLIIEGLAAAATMLQRAAKVLTDLPVEDVLRWGWVAPAASAAAWDHDGWHAIIVRHVQLVRDAGALSELPMHLSSLGVAVAWSGDFVDHVAAVPPRHLGDGPLGQPEEPGEVDPDGGGVVGGGVVGGGVVGERLGDEHARVVDQGVEAAEPFQRCADDPVGGRRVGDVSGDGEHVRVLRGLDRAGTGHHRPAPPPVRGDQAGADAPRGAGGQVLAQHAHDLRRQVPSRLGGLFLGGDIPGLHHEAAGQPVSGPAWPGRAQRPYLRQHPLDIPADRNPAVMADLARGLAVGQGG